jgi:hypothetical protein
VTVKKTLKKAMVLAAKIVTEVARNPEANSNAHDLILARALLARHATVPDFDPTKGGMCPTCGAAWGADRKMIDI